jgi:surfeit locus 1 family protein
MTIIAFNRYWTLRWPWILVNLFVVAILLGLSMWQWQRAAEKTQTLNRINYWQQQGELGSRQLFLLPPEERDLAQINFSARWIAPMVWLVDNQMVDGRPGYDVLVAVKDVKSSPDNVNAILVNLGWVAAPLARDKLPEVDVPTRLQVQGVFRTRVKGLLLGANMENKSVWPMRIQQVDLEALSPYVHAPLLQGVIYQQQKSPFHIHYRSLILSPERHKAYALQWLLLAIAVMVVALAASSRKISSEEKV